MWFYIIFGSVAVVSFVGIVVIIGRKFPQLSLIDTEALPKEQNLVRKRQIMDERVKRATKNSLSRILDFLTPRAVRVRDTFRRQVKRLLTLDRQFRNEKVLPPEKVEGRIEKLQTEATKLIEAEKLGEAEKKLIEVLALDELNEDAYRQLGDLYAEMKRWDRASDTHAFLVKLLVKNHCGQSVADSKGVPVPRFEAFADSCPADKAAHADIAKQYELFAEACLEAEDLAKARKGFEQAVAFEPANPRHLDSLVEACIIEGDKDRAVSNLKRLQAANPENQKIESFQQRIDELPDAEDEEVEAEPTPTKKIDKSSK